MNIYFQIEELILDPFKRKIKEEIMTRSKSFDDFDSLNRIMMDLVNEGKLMRYYISKNINTSSIGIKYIRITSHLDFDYTINFETIKEDFRDFRLNNLLLSEIKNKC
ncbi:MAG: hypothetical protein SLAVMIC_00183 [uncultured marine phage]|uniref:Uncharacterized protein n=1 Tax=uncultured marine phage TaxID=707152 RepID=A0A8D9C8H5_9VIRU|nr:MAG: hypothetical protein SLAVMIC_00183 [uncultured marine phage]